MGGLVGGWVSELIDGLISLCRFSIIISKWGGSRYVL